MVIVGFVNQNTNKLCIFGLREVSLLLAANLPPHLTAILLRVRGLEKFDIKNYNLSNPTNIWKAFVVMSGNCLVAGFLVFWMRDAVIPRKMPCKILVRHQSQE